MTPTQPNEPRQWDFDRWTHRVRWWLGYYLNVRSLPWVCERLGHDPVVSVDHDDGFDVTWCRRCQVVLRG